MNESSRTAKILKTLSSEFGCFTQKFSGSAFMTRGFPDSLIIKDGLHIWIEFKDEDEELEPLQVEIARRMRVAGAFVFKVNLHSKMWVINDLYNVQFKTYSEACKLFLEILILLCKNNKEELAFLDSVMNQGE